MNKFNFYTNLKKHKYIIINFILIISIIIYLQWSESNSSYMPSALNPMQHRVLHYYSYYGLGEAIERLLWDAFIFLIVYPAFIIYRLNRYKKTKNINTDFFYNISFVIIIILNVLYGVVEINHIHSDSILGYIDYLIINIIKYETYIPLILCYLFETVFKKK